MLVNRDWRQTALFLARYRLLERAETDRLAAQVVLAYSIIRRLIPEDEPLLQEELAEVNKPLPPVLFRKPPEGFELGYHPIRRITDEATSTIERTRREVRKIAKARLVPPLAYRSEDPWILPIGLQEAMPQVHIAYMVAEIEELVLDNKRVLAYAPTPSLGVPKGCSRISFLLSRRLFDVVLLGIITPETAFYFITPDELDPVLIKLEQMGQLMGAKIEENGH